MSRYYDPEIGRFITIDDIRYLDLNNINGYNLYPYCGNNPVMRIDVNGREWWNPFGWDWAAIGRAIGGVAISALGALLMVRTAPLFKIPIASFVPQSCFSLVMYGGYMTMSSFDKEIYNDMSSIGWNPLNAKEELVTSANKVSFYKGEAIVKGNFPGCMSFGMMFVDKGKWVTSDTIRHEYGHFIQLGILGLPKYLFGIGIPSLIGTQLTSDDLYNSQPWEVTADILGNANGYSHVNKSELIGWIYFINLLLI